MSVRHTHFVALSHLPLDAPPPALRLITPCPWKLSCSSPRIVAVGYNRPMRFRLVVRTGHPDFLDLPWEKPLEEWESERIVQVQRGIGRHVVRFVDYDGALYALKELPPRLAQREYRLLRALADVGLPAVDPVGVVSQRAESEESILVTRYLDFSLPYRRVLQRRVLPAPLPSLLDAFAQLLVRLHL